MLIGHVDTGSATLISGWAWDKLRNRPPPLTIIFPDETRDVVVPDLARPDVVAGAGTGIHCGFLYVVPQKQQRAGTYRVQFADGSPVANGVFTVSPQTREQAVEGRWRRDEPADSLTWGRLMTGDTFIDFMERNGLHLDNPTAYLEVGPGYGRILRTLRERWAMVRKYSGIELSEARVTQLSTEYPRPRFRFYAGSAETLKGTSDHDVLFCSSTFEHLYPDFTAALRNLRGWMKPRGRVFVDFVCADCRMQTSSAGFGNGAFVRTYSLDELRRLFRECETAIATAEIIVLGEGADGPVRRIAIAADFR